MILYHGTHMQNIATLKPFATRRNAISKPVICSLQPIRTLHCFIFVIDRINGLLSMKTKTARSFSSSTIIICFMTYTTMLAAAFMNVTEAIRVFHQRT